MTKAQTSMSNTTVDPTAAGDRVLAVLRNICSPKVKGAHDCDFVVIDGKAFIVYMANDVQAGEAPDWPFVYNALTVVDAATGTIEDTTTFAASEMRYDNAALPVGACFVPRIIPLDDDRRLRCFFASEDPARRQSQVWRIDYDRRSGTFDWRIFPVELETDEGVFAMQPQVLYRYCAARGFHAPATRHGLYMIGGLKCYGGTWHAVLNNFPGGQNTWAVLNAQATRFTALGPFFMPLEAKLTEAAVDRLPDGSWLAISRQENRDCNYMFSTSRDGRTWSVHEQRPWVRGGTASKPTLDRFGDTYYMGWQDAANVDGAYRSVFNLDVSRDGTTWTRRFRFATPKSFQYPTFRERDGEIYVAVTQGDHSPSRKERIMFGRLEHVGAS